MATIISSLKTSLNVLQPTVSPLCSMILASELFLSVRQMLLLVF